MPPNLTNFGRGVGQRLPELVQRKMEAAFNTSFADVRIYVGPQASSIGALAFTHGTDLYFAPGQYNPLTHQGQQLLGHELTHVVQQRAGRVKNPFGSGVAVIQDRALEAEADRMGRHAAIFRVPGQEKLAAVTVQRAATVHHAPFPVQAFGLRTLHGNLSGGGPRSSADRGIVQMTRGGGGKSKKKYKKGDKGGINCYLNGSKNPIPQGKNSSVHQHAERTAVNNAPSGNIQLEQNAWPCAPCHQWLQEQVTRLGITITVTVTDDQGGYSQDHGQNYGATGVLTYR